MALVQMHDMLRHAYDNKYAVGSFDVVSLDFLQGVINAAEQCRAPVILGLAEPYFEHFNLELLATAVESAARRSSVPVAIHYDHGSNVEGVIRGLRHGCNGVMIDASDRSLDENIAVTKEVVDMAHACGVPVEAELGYVPDSGDELIFTTVDEARGFVRLTGVDFLAVSIGTVHGRFKGKPRLDYPRLRHINEALKMPLVLHGSSGLSDDQLHRLIANGIAKVNAFTSITDRAAGLLRRNARAKDEGYIKLFSGVREEMEEEATRLMRTWGSAGRAAEVMEQCRPWHKVDYILKFNLPDADPEEMAMIVRRGREMLLPIPGVRNIEVSETVKNGTTPQYCWQMHLTSEEVVESLKQHSDFIKFNRRYISNKATDLTTTVYKTGQLNEGKGQTMAISKAS